MPKIKNIFKFEILLIVVSLFYYLFFANKGIIYFDEGYFTHAAERIFNGQVPYKDFSLQYGPTFFYVLAFLYKFFGASIIIGRYFTVFICLSIIAVVFLILNKLKFNSYLNIFLSFLALISFGYPLINIPNIMWANVLFALLLIHIYIYWLHEKTSKQLIFASILGILLAFSLSLKQNYGVAFIILFNFLIFISKKRSFETVKNLVLMNGVWMLSFLFGLYYFFLKDNLQGLFVFITYNRNFVAQSAFTYPPLSNIFKPFGGIKLLPYYLPFMLLIIVVLKSFRKNISWEISCFSLVSIVGFFISIYPQSDLLHCYPFFGLILISFILIFNKTKRYYPMAIFSILMITVGFYLTFFKGSYYYEYPYFDYKYPLNPPRTQGILAVKHDADAINKTAAFLNSHTQKNDYIFVYPTSPLLYFIFDRRNPSKDPIYYLRIWHFYDDKTILSEIKQKKVRYIITNRGYTFESALSKFIQRQKKVFEQGQFIVFEVVNKNL